jgi:hypothetical protein
MSRLKLIESEFARQSFIQMDRVLNLDPLSLRDEQRFNGQATAALTQRNNDSMGLRNRSQSLVQRSEEWHSIFEDPAGLPRLHEVQNPVSPPFPHFSSHGVREIVLTEDKDIFDERFYAHGDVLWFGVVL